jgi:hypothetical protein
MQRYRSILCNAIVVLAVLASSTAAVLASMLSLGPRGLQTLIAEQLFNRGGRWYLIDDGGVCYTYLESPRIHVEADRLILNAHLTSRLGQPIGNTCAGADFGSNVTLSGKLRGADHRLVLDDIRIDRIDDEATRNAFNLALQLAPQAIPRTASIDLLDLTRKQAGEIKGLPLHLEQFHIVSLTTRPEAIAIDFDLSLSTP